MTTIDTQVLDSLGLARQQDGKRDQLGQAEFLKLMVTQLNNQDPMKPMESGEFYTQIAQFSTVAGIQDLQGSFQQVATALYSSQALQASAMVGRSVMVTADSAQLTPGSEISGMVEVPAATSALSVSIYDSVGQLVRKIDMGAQQEGKAGFNWDGRTSDGEPAAAGLYYIEADMRLGNQTIGLETQLAARVDSVSMGGNGQGITLNLAGMGPIALASVKHVM